MLNTLTNEMLIEKTKALMEREREITSRLLECLEEMEHRRLHSKMGYSSLFDYLVKGMGYPEGSASLRINAMRLTKKIPEARAEIASGALTVTNAATLNYFMERDRKVNGKEATPTERLDLLKSISGKSKRECEKVLFTLSPKAMPRERVEPISGTDTKVTVVLGEDLMKKLDRIKELIAHKNPNPTVAELLDEMAEIVLKKIDPVQKKGKINATGKEALRQDGHENRTRYIPIPVRRTVMKRDGYACTYESPVTGKRCGSRWGIELDHIIPYALGGRSTVDNLQCRCGNHNKLEAIEKMGEKVMRPFLRL